MSVDEEDSHGQPGHRSWLCNTCYQEALRIDDKAREDELALARQVHAAAEETAAREFFAKHYGECEVAELRLKVWVPGIDTRDAEQLVREILADAQFDIQVGIIP